MLPNWQKRIGNLEKDDGCQYRFTFPVSLFYFFKSGWWFHVLVNIIFPPFRHFLLVTYPKLRIKIFAFAILFENHFNQKFRIMVKALIKISYLLWHILLYKYPLYLKLRWNKSLLLPCAIISIEVSHLEKFLLEYKLIPKSSLSNLDFLLR